MPYISIQFTPLKYFTLSFIILFKRNNINEKNKSYRKKTTLNTLYENIPLLLLPGFLFPLTFWNFLIIWFVSVYENVCVVDVSMWVYACVSERFFVLFSFKDSLLFFNFLCWKTLLHKCTFRLKKAGGIDMSNF